MFSADESFLSSVYCDSFAVDGGGVSYLFSEGESKRCVDAESVRVTEQRQKRKHSEYDEPTHITHECAPCERQSSTCDTHPQKFACPMCVSDFCTCRHHGAVMLLFDNACTVDNIYLCTPNAKMTACAIPLLHLLCVVPLLARKRVVVRVWSASEPPCFLCVRVCVFLLYKHVITPTTLTNGVRDDAAIGIKAPLRLAIYISVCVLFFEPCRAVCMITNSIPVWVSYPCVLNSVWAAVCLQLNTWLNRNRYLIVAAFRGISSKKRGQQPTQMRVCGVICLSVYHTDVYIYAKTKNKIQHKDHHQDARMLRGQYVWDIHTYVCVPTRFSAAASN